MYSAYKLNKQGDNVQLWCNPFPVWNQSVIPCLVLTVSSWSAYRFLRRQVRWSGIPISKNFPQFVVVHTVKDFSIVNETEVHFFLPWNSLAYSMIQRMLAIWSLVPLPFLNPACTSGSSHFTYCWSQAWSILSITLLACEMSVVVWQFEHFFGTAFLWNWNENWPFPVLWPLLSFPNLLAYWVQHFHSIFF